MKMYNGILLGNRQIHSPYNLSEKMFVAVMVIVCGSHGLWPSLSNPHVFYMLYFCFILIILILIVIHVLVFSVV